MSNANWSSTKNLNVLADGVQIDDGLCESVGQTNAIMHIMASLASGASPEFAALTVTGNVAISGNLYQSDATDSFDFAGDVAFAGAWGLFRGGSHATQAGDFFLGSGATTILSWDESLDKIFVSKDIELTGQIVADHGDGANGFLQTTGGGTPTTLATYASETTGGWIGTTTADPFKIYTNNSATPNAEFPSGGGALITGDFTVDTTTLHVNSTNNRVGLGTTLPARGLDIAIGNTVRIREEGSATNYIEFGTNANADFVMNADPGNAASGTDFQFRIDNSEVMRLASTYLRPATDNAVDLGQASLQWKDGYFAGAIEAASISFDGGTNTLANYVEGTWTPVLADASTGGNTATIQFNSGRYTRIGRTVYWEANMTNINTTGMTAGNDLYLRGFPITPAAGFNYTGTDFWVNGVTFAGSNIRFRILASQAYGRFQPFNSFAYENVSIITSSPNSDIEIQGWYVV